MGSKSTLVTFVLLVFSTVIVLIPASAEAEKQEKSVTLTPNNLKDWKQYDDAAYGYSVVVPENAEVEPASGQPGSVSTFTLHNSADPSHKAVVSIGAFVGDKPVGTKLSEWVQPSPTYAADLINAQELDDAGIFAYSQVYSGLSHGEYRSILRAYTDFGSKVFFADLEPSNLDWARSVYWEILRSWKLITPYVRNQPETTFAYSPITTDSTQQIHSAASLPTGYSLPIMGDEAITQKPGGSFSHKCHPSGNPDPSYPDCGAIDIDIDEYGTNIDPVFAPADGTLYTQQDPYGNTAKIVHNNGATTYLGHLEDFRLSNGTGVSRGTMIGTGGNSGGFSTGSHVHWIIRPDANTEYEHINIVGVQGLDMQKNLAHGPVVLNDSGILPIQDSNATSFSSDDESLPYFLQHPYNVTIGKGWSTILFEETNYQGDWEYFGPGTSFTDNPSPVRSLRVYFGICPLPPNNLLASIDQAISENYPDCSINPPPPSSSLAHFVRDVTIPDGFVASPGQSLTKTWRIRNTGSTSWGSGYLLVFVGGEQMGAPGAVTVPSAGPGQEVDISTNITAPSSSGEHKGYWQLRNPQGTYFGPRMWVEIDVQQASSLISTLTADPPPPADTADVTIRASAYNFPNLRAMRVKINGEVKYELGAPEITYNWHTAGYSPGDHSIVVEAADWGDLSWDRPEQRSMIYHLTGNAGADNRAPNHPDPTSPHDWYVYYSGNTARLCASNNGDPDGDAITGYYFDVYESAQIWNSGWVSGSCVTTSSLGPYNYKWRVKVRDSHGKESDWSDSWHFTLVNPNLEITEMYFEALDPRSEVIKIRACTEGQGGVGITMRVSVNDANDGSANGNWRIIHELGVPCYNEVDAPTWNSLNYETGTYRFRVEAHGSGSGWDGAASREETYTVPDRRPNSPELLSPRPSSRDTREAIYLDSRTVTFRWNEPLRATGLTLHVGDSGQTSPKDDATPVYRQTLSPSTTEHTVTFDQDYPTLYWQVEATNSLGSNASGDQQFGIDRTSPTCSIDTLPGVSYENVFQVKWSSADVVAGVKTADIQVLDSGRDEWLDWLTNIPLSQTYDLFTGQAGHSYQFRCRATDNAGNTGNYSSPSTEIVIDPESRPTETWWNVSYDSKRTVSILNNMAGKTMPAAYPVHIRFDSTTTPSAADIYNGSATSTKCNDVRIVHNNTTELDRYVQTCTSSRIDIWFKIQSAIGAGAVDSDSYRLYYGNAAAGSPPADQKQVWPPLMDANTVGLWFLSEGTGSTTVDHSGHGNNGNRGNLVWIDGKFGNALTSPSPDQDGGGMFVPGSASMNSSDFTLEFFAKRSDTKGGYIAGMGTSGSNRERMRLRVDGLGKLKFQIDPLVGGASDVWAQSGCLPDLEWHHVAVTFDGNRTGKIYCDGTLRGSGTFNDSGISNLNFDLYVGSDFSTETRFHGAIDQVRLSNNVRTSFPHGSFAAITNEPSLAVGELFAPPSTGEPDLVLMDLQTFPSAEGGVIVQATIMNQGDRATNNGFFTDLYESYIPGGPGDLSNSISFWVNESIEPDETVELITSWTAAEDPLNVISNRSSVAASGEIRGTLYAQVDSSGVITEPDDANNIHDLGIDYCLAESDLYEDDDSAANASTIALDEIQTHSFSKLDDEDWVQFTAQAGMTYRLSTSGLATAADTYLYLYDTDGTTLLAANDDEGGSLASTIIWQAPADSAYYAVVSHWNPNAGGCDNTYSLELAEAAVTHGIQLATGWNMLSTYVTPEDSDMDAIFPIPERDDLVLCKDDDGRIYWPEYGIDTIVDWDPARGYKCYTSQGFNIGMYGLPIDPSESIELNAGWSMVAYWRDSPMPVEDALLSLGDALVLVKTVDGKIYWPEYGINTIGEMQPGQGYKIYLNAPATLTYPPN